MQLLSTTKKVCSHLQLVAESLFFQKKRIQSKALKFSKPCGFESPGKEIFPK